MQDTGRLRAAIAVPLTNLGLDLDAVLEACVHCLTLPELRERLGLDFGALNASLLATEQNPTQIPSTIGCRSNTTSPNERWRLSTLSVAPLRPFSRRRYRRPTTLACVTACRAFEPEAAWCLTHEFLPEDLLELLLTTWLREAGAPPLGTDPYGLAPLHGVRAANMVFITKFVESAGPVVRAWCISNDTAAPEVWSDLSSAVAKLRTRLDKAGAFDFAVLNEEALIAWLGVLNGWPENMPSTLDRGVLKITSTEVDDQEAKAKRDKADRERQARSVLFNGRDVDPLDADWNAISAEIETGLSRKDVVHPYWVACQSAPRGEVAQTRWARETNSAGGDVQSRLPQAKKDMIGRLGELIVYHWLRVRLPGQDIDKAWRSSNAAVGTARTGQDDLGYDFEIKFNKQTWYIEAKATTTDQLRFEMGETEVRMARESARPKSRARYMIAFVSNASDPGRARIDMLPNPMTDEGSKVLEILGEGICYGFRRRG